MTVNIRACSEHERRAKYFKNVPFGDVALVRTAIGDCTLMSEEKIGVGTALEAIEVQMLRRNVRGTSLVKAMMIGMQAG